MIKDYKVDTGRKSLKIHMERFESAVDTVEANNKREMTSHSFQDVRSKQYSDWEGCKSYDDAQELMRTGYQPTVDAMKDVWNGKSGELARFQFRNEIVGFAPVVPLAMKGVPNCMINMRMTPIKAKVLDVYYDITASCGTSASEFIRVGQAILGAIVDLEMQGYRFNLYGVQTYNGGGSCDMLVVKLKSASQPLDIKRISFPLTHPAFFRVFGFDWYSRVPGGTYRGGYGCALGYDYSKEQLNSMAKQVFGKNSVYLTATSLIREKNTEKIKEVLKNANSEN